MSTTTFGKKAVELVREIADSEAGSLPPYNQDLIRTIADQCLEHADAMAPLATVVNETTAGDGVSEEEAEGMRMRAQASILAHNQVGAYATIDRWIDSSSSFF